MPTGLWAGAGARLALLLAVIAAASAVVARAEGASGPSGLPLPRFVSLKVERVNVRAWDGYWNVSARKLGGIDFVETSTDASSSRVS